MLSTRVRTLLGRTAAHVWPTALFSSATVEGGSSMSRIQTDIWSQNAQLGSCLDSELASRWPQHPVGPKRLPCHVLYGAGHCLGRTSTPVVHGNIWFLMILLYRCRFMAPSTTFSSLLPPRWIAPYSMTDGPWFPSLGWTQPSISFSPCLRRTRTRPSLWYRENKDSSLRIQCLHCLSSHTLCLLPHSRRRRLCSKVSLGHLAGRRNHYPVARSHLRRVRTDIRLPNRRIICIRRRGAKMKHFVLIIWSSWRSSRALEIFFECPRFLWCGRPVSRFRRKTLLMHPWDTPSILATSRWELPSADNLTIRYSIYSGKFYDMVPFKSSKKYQ